MLISLVYINIAKQHLVVSLCVHLSLRVKAKIQTKENELKLSQIVKCTL